MRHLFIILLTNLAAALLSLARWLDGGAGPGSRKCKPVKRVDLPRSSYHFRHVPPSRWQVMLAGVVILFTTARFAAGVGV